MITNSCSTGTGCNDRGLTNAKLALDENTGDVYYYLYIFIYRGYHSIEYHHNEYLLEEIYEWYENLEQ